MDFGWGLCLKKNSGFLDFFNAKMNVGINLMSLENIWQTITNFSTTF
jgi:hypothetical protein